MLKLFKKDTSAVENLGNFPETEGILQEKPVVEVDPIIAEMEARRERRAQRLRAMTREDTKPVQQKTTPLKVEGEKSVETTLDGAKNPEEAPTFRILALGHERNNNTWDTRLNNNDLIIGPSGAGKTRNYVKPNIMQGNESMIIADTKGNLAVQMGPLLKARGYKVVLVDFKNMAKSYGYNPFDFIYYNRKEKCYHDQDIIAMAETLCPVESIKEPFWEQAAKQYATMLICYTLEVLDKEHHNFTTLCNLVSKIGSTTVRNGVEKVKKEKGNCLLVQLYEEIEKNFKADKTHQCVLMILSEKLYGFSFEDANKMYKSSARVNFSTIAQEKTALFLNISDYDRSLDRLVSLFYTQAIRALLRTADVSPGERLAVPVRFIFDDFATNCIINKFDNIISVIRSREIYFSIIIQSISQLDEIYGKNKAKTIINNCDTCLYLGGQDVETAEFMAKKSNVPVNKILTMPLNRAFLFTRGKGGELVQLYDLKLHKFYQYLPEAMGEPLSDLGFMTKERLKRPEERPTSVSKMK